MTKNTQRLTSAIVSKMLFTNNYLNAAICDINLTPVLGGRKTQPYTGCCSTTRLNIYPLAI